ncbi:C40 family peptidase [Daejeonella oryzae]|uniref:C40 family peptidase n=1 Tax=Daejeonella oryzae TaxID=1122943 RepID=UPI00041BD964|nr:C40 family peptidase [Daejeonella oryzae]
MNQIFGVCNLSLIPLRAAASDKSEMISQLLFGDNFEVLEMTEKWTRIITSYDQYEGWIDSKQFVETDLASFNALNYLQNILRPFVYHPVKNIKANEVLNLVAGSNLPAYNDGVFVINATKYSIGKEAVIHPVLDTFKDEIENVAKLYLHTPYLWGGRSVFGIDCSGFTQMVFKQFGIRIQRDAWQQALQGFPVDFLQETKPGDLAFFDNEEGRIIHVGIMLDNEHIIHASGRVKIDKIDTTGIYSEELKRYTHQLRIIKRFKN